MDLCICMHMSLSTNLLIMVGYHQDLAPVDIVNRTIRYNKYPQLVNPRASKQLFWSEVTISQFSQVLSLRAQLRDAIRGLCIWRCPCGPEGLQSDDMGNYV